MVKEKLIRVTKQKSHVGRDPWHIFLPGPRPFSFAALRAYNRKLDVELYREQRHMFGCGAKKQRVSPSSERPFGPACKMARPLPVVQRALIFRIMALNFKRWPQGDVPRDDGFVVVVLHRQDQATVIVLPPSSSKDAHPDDVELDTAAALETAQEQAAFYGLSTVYVATSDAAPWNPAWGELQVE
jgi:hypothetical protein